MGVQQLNLKTLVIQPGHFRTDATNLSRFEFDCPTTNYAQTNEVNRHHIQEKYGKNGDVKKACKVLIDLVKGEGDVQRRDLVSSLSQGTDSWEACVKGKE